MPRSIRTSAAPILAACIAAGALADNPVETFRAYAGEPFGGSVVVRVINPENPARPVLRERGPATAQFVEENGETFRLILNGTIDQEGDAGFTVTGTLDETGWRSGTQDVSMSVGPDGKITGGGTQSNQKMTFSGEVTAIRFRIEVEAEMLEETAGGFPVGTTFHYNFNMRRVSTLQEGPGERETDGECRRIVWQSRNLPNLGGGSMIFTQVPVCVN